MAELYEIERRPEALDAEFRAEVRRGLSARPKTLPCRFFYDARGSRLFEEITELPEYYPTRTEIGLLKQYGGEIAREVPEGASVIEFGSGSSRKTELLLSALERPASYIPIDISAAALFPAAARVQENFPALAVNPVLGGFQHPGSLRLPKTDGFRLGFFPGSTIGNMDHSEARDFLRAARGFLGENAGFLVGVDLKKPLDILLPAYNDARGVTAAFNLNILARINRELGGCFDLDAFAHEAIYNADEGRIEIHIRSLRSQRVRAAGNIFEFEAGETIHTENSHKFSVEEFQGLARKSGWTPARCMVDERCLFSLHFLT